MRGRSPTLAALALFAAGALLANVAENRLAAGDRGSAAESAARLEGARLRLHRGGAVRYGADVAAMQFAESGAVALESVAGRIRLGERHVAFRSGRGAVGPDASALELDGEVRIELELDGHGHGQASVIRADSAVLHFEGAAGLRAHGAVRIDAGGAAVEAASLEWSPGEPLLLEGVRAQIP